MQNERVKDASNMIGHETQSDFLLHSNSQIRPPQVLEARLINSLD